MAKRVFQMAGSGAIKVIYHYGDDRVTASFRSYAKDGTDHVVVQVDLDLIYVWPCSTYHGPPYSTLTPNPNPAPNPNP